MEAGETATPAKTPSLLANSRWNLLAFGSSLAAHFIVIPLVVRWIGLSAFGVASLVLAIAAPLSILGTVVGQSITKDIAAELGRGATGNAGVIFNTAKRVIIMTAMAGTVLLIAAGPPLLSLSEAVSAFSLQLELAFLLCGIGWASQQFVFLHTALMSAHQDFFNVARSSFLSAAATIIATLGATWIFGGLLGYLAGFAISFCCSALIWSLSTRRYRRDSRWFGIWDRPAFFELWRFCRWQGAAQVVGALGQQADRYALGALAQAAVLGQYSTAKRLSEAVYMGAMKLGEVLLPHFGSTAHQPEPTRQAFFLRASWLTTTASVVFMAPLFVVAESALTLWVGPEATEGSGGQLLRTLVMVGVIACGSNVFSYCAMAMGRPDLVARLALTHATISVIGTCILVPVFGVVGAGGGLLIASLVRVAMAMRWSRTQLFESADRVAIGLSIALPIASAGASAMLLNQLGFGAANSWIELILAYLLTAIGMALAIVITTGCSRRGRDLLHSMLDQHGNG